MTRKTDHFGPMVLDALTGNPPAEKTSTRATCRMTTAKGNRCTGEALDPDAKVVQICTRHAAEVMQLINERTAR